MKKIFRDYLDLNFALIYCCPDSYLSSAVFHLVEMISMSSILNNEYFWYNLTKEKKTEEISWKATENLNMLQKVTWVQSRQVFQSSQQQIGSYILGKAKRKTTFSSFTFLYYTTTHRIIFHILKKLDIIIFQYQSFSALLIKFVSHPKILT